MLASTAAAAIARAVLALRRLAGSSERTMPIDAANRPAAATSSNIPRIDIMILVPSHMGIDGAEDECRRADQDGA